ncbi:hypothetical protein ACFOLC_15855 [Lysobacter cavernae]|uniref:ABC transporter ATP-binding protein n=1 Tax=Lysobacter cavernae TaxID=1685901 RepID=A0ABV7RSB0_9GAMM
MSDELPEIHERVTAGRLLSLVAAHVSEHMGSFGNWLLVGVGATYSLVLANLASVQQFVSLWSIRTGLLLLLAAVILGVLQRWLAAIVSASSAAAEKSDKIGHALAEQDIDIDFRALFREMERGIYYPAKWIVRRSFNKAMSGDFAAAGRMSAGISQVQSFLVLAQAGFAIAAIATIARGVKV